MKYKAVVTKSCAKPKKMAVEIEMMANEAAKNGGQLVTFSITNSQKAILIFAMPDDVYNILNTGAETAQIEC